VAAYMNPHEIMARFRALEPLQQAVTVGVLFLLINYAYYYFATGMKIVTAAEHSLYAAILFMCVYYFTTVTLVRKSMAETARSKAKGPKGRRKV
jgi:hypothetical protein